MRDSYDWLVIEYVRHCYRYYVKDEPTISDGEFDLMARELYKNYDSLSNFSKTLISEDELFCGTYLGRDYPKEIIGDLI